MAGPSESFPAAFCLPVLDLLPVQAIRIAENSRCLLEWDAVLLVVLQGFAGVPGEHISVYTLIGRRCQYPRCQAETDGRNGSD